MAHVAHEPALLREAVADPVEHRVEGAGQGGHVVIRIRDGDPPVQVVGRDRAGRVPQLRERAHEATAHQLPRDRGQEEDAQRGRGVDPCGVPDRLALGRHPVDGGERALPVVARDGDGCDRGPVGRAVDRDVRVDGPTGDGPVVELGEDLRVRQGEVHVLRLVQRPAVQQRDDRFVLARHHRTGRGAQQVFQAALLPLHRQLRHELQLVDLLAQLCVDPRFQICELRGVADRAGGGQTQQHEREHHREDAAAHRARPGYAGGRGRGIRCGGSALLLVRPSALCAHARYCGRSAPACRSGADRPQSLTCTGSSRPASSTT